MPTLIVFGVGLLIGAALGLRFTFLILFPAVAFAIVGIAGVGIAHGDRIASMVLTMIVLGSALQIGFLAGLAARALFPSKRVPNADVPLTFAFAAGQNGLSLVKSLDVQNLMEVVGSDGKHVGTVDHKESADRIMLTKDDPNAAGRPHLISIEWVDYVNAKIHLNKPAKKAMAEWEVVA